MGLGESSEHDSAGSAQSPRRLHPTSLLFLVLSSARQSLIPVIVAGYSAVRGNTVGMIIACGIVGLVAFFAIIRYLTFRYRIADGELVVTEGLISRKVRTVPIDRIQNVDLLQNLFHRIFGVAEVRVETASGTEPEATLRVLSMKDVARLRSEIFEKRHRKEEPFGQAVACATESGVAKTVLEIPTSWLIKAGLASNKGMILVGVAMGLFFQQDWEKRIDLEQLADNVPKDAPLPTWTLIPLAIVALLVLIRILGVGWYLLRFHGYRLERLGDDFHLSCGLLTKVSATVPRRRIQFISIHRTPLLRWMKLASVRIETAGGSGTENEDAAATVTRRWFVPVIPDAALPGLVGQLRAGFEMDESEVPWQPVSPRAGRRLTKLCLILATLAAVIGMLVTRPWGWLLGAACLPIFLFLSRRHLKILAYARVGDGFLLRSGVWTRKTSVTFFDRIQALSMNQSPFDRRWGMSRLSIDTAAAGPADHDMSVSLIDTRVAEDEFSALVEQSSKVDMIWN